VLRSDGSAKRPAASFVRRGATAVARTALAFALPSAILRRALVNGVAGVVVIAGERPISVMGFVVTGGKVVEIDVVADPEVMGRLDLTVLND
jgi:hypothetical protein